MCKDSLSASDGVFSASSPVSFDFQTFSGLPVSGVSVKCFTVGGSVQFQLNSRKLPFEAFFRHGKMHRMRLVFFPSCGFHTICSLYLGVLVRRSDGRTFLVVWPVLMKQKGGLCDEADETGEGPNSAMLTSH